MNELASKNIRDIFLTLKRPAAVVETGPAAARAAAEAAFGLARVRDEIKAPAHAQAHVPGTRTAATTSWLPPAPPAPYVVAPPRLV